MRRVFVKEGFEYTLNNRVLLLQHISMTKENAKFPDDKIEKMLSIISPHLEYESDEKILHSKIGRLKYFDNKSISENPIFYKFIYEDTYRNYLSKGKFQLGSLKYYREIENQDSRDELEGYSSIILDTDKRQIHASVLSGFNHFLLCGTSSLDSKEYMGRKFGGYVMKIKNVNSFAQKVKVAIGALEWTVDHVQYTNYKAFRAERKISDISGVGPNLSSELFDLMYELSERPSIFSKPTRFKPENELRLCFKMPKRVKSKLNFDNKGLLDEIEFININDLSI